MQFSEKKKHDFLKDFITTSHPFPRMWQCQSRVGWQRTPLQWPPGRSTAWTCSVCRSVGSGCHRSKKQEEWGWERQRHSRPELMLYQCGCSYRKWPDGPRGGLEQSALGKSWGSLLQSTSGSAGSPEERLRPEILERPIAKQGGCTAHWLALALSNPADPGSTLAVCKLYMALPRSSNSTPLKN